MQSVLVFDPMPAPFDLRVAEVMAVDGRKVKVRDSDRKEGLLNLSADQSIPMIGAKLVARLAQGFLVDIVSVGMVEDTMISDAIYDEQTKRQLDEEFAGGIYD